MLFRPRSELVRPPANAEANELSWISFLNPPPPRPFSLPLSSLELRVPRLSQTMPAALHENRVIIYHKLQEMEINTFVVLFEEGLLAMVRISISMQRRQNKDQTTVFTLS